VPPGLAAVLAAGVGIGELPPIVRPDLLVSGKLVEVMPRWKLATETLSMVHLGGRHIARPLRAFMDFATTAVPQLFPNLPCDAPISSRSRYRRCIDLDQAAPRAS
jgi:DNA-binding transcriptional LysR family regulator